MIFYKLKECLKGKSLSRVLQNRVFKNIIINGKTIDLGAKNGNASYYRFFNLKNSEINYVDINPTESNVLILDLEKNLPIKEKSYNSVIAINLFEHIFNIQNLIEEIYRILDDKGKLIGSTPFIKEYHSDPSDYYRYTQDFYKKAFEKIGFVNIELILVGQGLFHLVAESVGKLIKIKILRYLFWELCINIDKLLNKFYKNNKNYYCSIIFLCEK
jgi:SAM-dependent methyltransferase